MIMCDEERKTSQCYVNYISLTHLARIMAITYNGLDSPPKKMYFQLHESIWLVKDSHNLRIL